jgi:DNA topoisomerase IA
MTMQIGQSLYEKYKCITCLRTNSQALTEEYVSTCNEILAAVNHKHRIFAQRIIENKAVNANNKNNFNKKSVTDHFGIIPMPQARKIIEWRI